jgi:hypothetical protein
MNETVSKAPTEAVGGVGGIGGIIGQAAQQAQPLAASVTRSASKKVKTTKRSNGQAATTTSPDPNIRVCSITLPKDVFERYEQAAAAAPFEPSVQKYLSWELRELDKRRQAVAQTAALAQGLQAQGFVPGSGADGPQRDDFGR